MKRTIQFTEFAFEYGRRRNAREGSHCLIGSVSVGQSSEKEHAVRKMMCGFFDTNIRRDKERW
jgi:hypothetical protein